MAIISITTALLNDAGLLPHNLARNGIPPSAPAVREIADALNCLLGRRVRFLSASHVPPAQSYAVSGVQTTYRFRTHLSPNGTTVRIKMTLIPTDTHATLPTGWWVVTNKDTGVVAYDDGTSGTDRSFTFDGSLATPTSAVPDDYTYVQRMFPGLTGGADYTFEFKQKNLLRPLGYTAYEVARTSLDTANDTVVDTTRIIADRPIYDADVLDLLAALESAWQRLGPQHLAWTINSITPRSTTSGAMINLIDGTTTTSGWTTTTPGAKAHLQYHDSADTRQAATYSVPVRIYCYAGAPVGTGTVRVRYGTGGSDYLEIPNITTAGWYTAAGTLPLGNADGSKCDITGAIDTGISATGLTSGKDTTPATSFATASISPGGSRLILAWVANVSQPEQGSTPTLTGNGITWVQVATVSLLSGTTTYRTTLFRGMVASPTTGAVTIDFGVDTQAVCAWAIGEWTGVDTSGTNGSGAIVQSGTVSNAAANTGMTVSLAAFGHPLNGVAYGANLDLTIEAGYTLLYNEGPPYGVGTEYQHAADTTPSATWASQALTCAVAAEIRARVLDVYAVGLYERV